MVCLVGGCSSRLRRHTPRRPTARLRRQRCNARRAPPARGLLLLLTALPAAGGRLARPQSLWCTLDRPHGLPARLLAPPSARVARKCKLMVLIRNSLAPLEQRATGRCGPAIAPRIAPCYC
jgi:hypothetical protein